MRSISILIGPLLHMLGLAYSADRQNHVGACFVALGVVSLAPTFKPPSTCLPHQAPQPALTLVPNATMQNATLYYCESSLFNSTNCPGFFEAGIDGRRNRCLTTDQVDIPVIALNYSQTNSGGQGMACTNPASSSAGGKVKVARGLLLITLLTCLFSAAFGQPMSGDLRLEEKRDVTCKSFLPTGREKITTSRLTKTSAEVDCRQSGAPCTVSIGDGKKLSFASEYFIDGGGSVKELDLQATFGSSAYTQSYSSKVIYTSWIPVGQCGYLTSYSDATLFEGYYRDCSDGGNRTGTAVVVRKGSPLSSLVLTSC